MLDGPSLLDSGISTTEWTIFKIGENAIVTLSVFFTLKPEKLFKSDKKLIKKILNEFYMKDFSKLDLYHSTYYGIFNIGKLQITGLV